MIDLPTGSDPGQATATTSGRGPHPLPLFLALAARIANNDPERLGHILAGVRRYQQAPPAPAMPAFSCIAKRGDVRLLHVGGPPGGPAVVVVPSLINAPAVLDLAPERSLVRFMAARGLNTFLIDWGPMTGGERRLGMAGLVSARLLPLLESLDRPIRLVGYCVGGTLAVAAAQLLQQRLERLALLATPWHFDGFPDEARLRAVSLYRNIRPIGDALGALPITLVNPLFWSLDEEAVINKFAKLATRPADDPHIQWFARVEDWANSGAPLTISTARDLFLKGYGSNRMGKGQWRVKKCAINPETIVAPILDIGALNDRIVPDCARLRLPRAERLMVPAGHVGMVVGSAAPEQLWEPLSNWLLKP